MSRCTGGGRVNDPALEWVRAVGDYLKYLAPVLVPLIGMAFRLRHVNGKVKNKPDLKQVDKLIALGLTVVEEKLLLRIQGLEGRLHECEAGRVVAGEQNARLVQANTRLVERIERLLATRGGGA